uniref:Uncharacterized protein n=1 Tax=Rhizophora mucronata TaxID=61149 RepID=A0A2P2L552_RHIMU
MKKKIKYGSHGCFSLSLGRFLSYCM